MGLVYMTYLVAPPLSQLSILKEFPCAPRSSFSWWEGEAEKQAVLWGGGHIGRSRQHGEVEWG